VLPRCKSPLPPATLVAQRDRADRAANLGQQSDLPRSATACFGGIDVSTNRQDRQEARVLLSVLLGRARHRRQSVCSWAHIMGKISAFDKDTMQELWSFDTGTQSPAIR
jgi:hypothetical protein